MMKWRKHPDADNLISTAINYKLEEALGIISCSAPLLCKRLVDIGLSERTRPYTAVDSLKLPWLFYKLELLIERIKRRCENYLDK